MIELAGVRLSGGKLVEGDTFRQLLRPGDEPIPAVATRIHGIDDAAVAAAPPFAEVWPRFEAFLGRSIVIGHTVGFDLAVLKRECGLAGLPWSRPRTLDTRLLAQIAAPELAGYTLEKLADWLGIDVVGRHSALGDAVTTARVFLALVPKLRDHDIRTVAEAERACRALSAVLDDQVRIGWVEAVEPPARIDAEQTLERFDAYAYRHRTRDIMRTPAIFVAPDVPIREALARMARENISSLYVHEPHAAAGTVTAAEAGIVTERDVLRAIDRLGAAALEKPVGRIMTRPLVSIPADAFVYRAIGRMSRLKIRHLGVVDEAGHVIGALSARDLLRLRAGEAISLGDEIDDAEDAHALSVAWAKLPRVAEALLAEGLSGREIAEVISSELRALSSQAAVIAEQIMRKRGLGGPPVPYALIVLGSAGRGESLLAMDQDNAVIFERGEPEGERGSLVRRHSARMSPTSCMKPACPIARAGSWRKTRLARLGRNVAGAHRQMDHALKSRGSPVGRYFLRLAGRPRRWRPCRRGEAGRLCRGRGSGRVRQASGRGHQDSGQPGIFRRHPHRRRPHRSQGHGLYGLVAAARAMAIRHHVMDRRHRRGWPA